ncbi:cobalt-precorrin-5B (C(1))-methyltransferase CbiD [Nodosilinea sp. P-1105]|uniref:cobalt-precorrin-5B (C(1))-methyltransferase CbiD n=1 Tax=Nodosilinea sp. P-1105 TaxID=2546229 RepID=UPI00146B887E|nr:cobalt-precorrin-5B (C(1))-methyltransferase CbiD [Nodosilinea sp. P-1105]NMF84750.1 cobalt-precorrin-5B (C(1))-methyltransferase [Nodosilinea sp. P-1105]
MARSGYTLPVFAVAAAKAALTHLLAQRSALASKADIDGAQGRAAPLSSPEVQARVHLDPGEAQIPIQQVATLDPTTALAICLSDPGDNLDVTRNTPVWAWVQLVEFPLDPPTAVEAESLTLILEAGEGLGRTAAGEPAFYTYARQLFDINVRPLIPAQHQATVRIILPEGVRLAQQTSNAAFGILDGLALLGTNGISQPHSATDQLDDYRAVLQTAVQTTSHLVFCIGHNGQRTAQRLGIADDHIVQTGNWLGAMLVEAGLRGAESVLLLGYQGKLIKLAGGIFNTSSHVADGKLAILAAALAQVEINSAGEATDAPAQRLSLMQAVLDAPTADAAHQRLIAANLADPVFTRLARQVSDRAAAYIRKYAAVSVKVETILCDRQGHVIGQTVPLPPYLLGQAK